jgi:hypothetical protein
VEAGAGPPTAGGGAVNLAAAGGGILFDDVLCVDDDPIAALFETEGGATCISVTAGGPSLLPPPTAPPGRPTLPGGAPRRPADGIGIAPPPPPVASINKTLPTSVLPFDSTINGPLLSTVSAFFNAPFENPSMELSNPVRAAGFPAAGAAAFFGIGGALGAGGGVGGGGIVYPKFKPNHQTMVLCATLSAALLVSNLKVSLQCHHFLKLAQFSRIILLFGTCFRCAYLPRMRFSRAKSNSLTCMHAHTPHPYQICWPVQTKASTALPSTGYPNLPSPIQPVLHGNI